MPSVRANGREWEKRRDMGMVSRMGAVWWLVPSSGGCGYTTTPLLSIAGKSRGIWAASLPIPSDITGVLEYVVVAQWGDGAQSVVFLD